MTNPGEELIHIFVAQDLEAVEAEPDYDENLQLECLALADAVDRCLRGEIQDAKTIAGLLAVNGSLTTA